MQGTRFVFDDFELDVHALELWRSGQLVKADAVVLRLLEEFLRNPGELLTKERLLERVWDGRVATENSLTVAVTRLRKVLGQGRPGSTCLATVHGYGYRFVRPVVRRDSAAAFAQTSSGPLRPQIPFVGRDGPVQLLRDALELVSAGSGGLVVVSGEAGIGKTRLAEVIAARALPHGVSVAWGYCHAELDMPALWPFVQVLRQIFLASQANRTLLEQPWAQHVRLQLVRLLPELTAAEATPPPAAESCGKPMLFDAVSQWLQSLTVEQPWLLVIDDLQLADAASLELLLYLLPALQRMRCLVVATLRDPALTPSADSTLLRRVRAHRNCRELRLGRLACADVAEFVAAWHGAPNPPLSQRLFQLSEGNPFFMMQLSHSLRDRTADLAELPGRVLDLLQERFAALDPSTLAVLQSAALQGRRFSLSVLHAVSGGEFSAIMASVDAACSGGMVTRVEGSLNHFAFTHELLRDALCCSMSEDRKRRAHLRIGETLERSLASGQDISWAELAYHFRSALPDVEPRRVVDYCVRASAAAASVFGFSDAACHLKYALQALDFVDGASARLRLRLMWNLAYCQRHFESPEFAPLIDQVIRLAKELGDEDILARAALLLSPGSGLPSYPGASAAVQAALAALPLDAPELRGAALARLAVSAPLAYDRDQADLQLRAAHEVSRKTYLDEYLTLDAELFLRGGPAHRADTVKILQQIHDLTLRFPIELAVASIHVNIFRAIVCLQDGDQAAALRAMNRATERSSDVLGVSLWHTERFSLLCRVNRDGVAANRADLLSLGDADNRHGTPGAALLCAYDRSVVLGQPLELEAWPCLHVQDDDPPNFWALKVRALLAAGLRHEAALALRRVRAEQLVRLPCDRDYLGTLGALAQVAVALDARDYIAALYELLLPYRCQFAVSISFFCEGPVATLLGMLAGALGRSAEAVEALTEGLEASERAGYADCAAAARQLLRRYRGD